VNVSDNARAGAGGYGHQVDYLSNMTKQLASITSRLRLLGIIILSTTLLNIGVLVGGVADSIAIRQYNQINSSDIANGIINASYFSIRWLIANLVIFAISLIVLGVTDVLKRRGDAFFQEISNAFQEFDKEPDSDVPKVPSDLLSEARISIRSFVSSADPPLIRGRYGTGIYALVNIAIILIAVIIYSQVA
jgi:hypothetical protein